MEYKKLSEVCDVRDGTHDSPKYVTEGYPLVTSKNIVDGKLDLSVINYLSQEDYDKINERSKVDVGDIIMPMIGTIGNPYIVEDFTDFAIKNVALVKFPYDSINNRYVWYYLKSESFNRYVAEKNKGGTQKFLSLGDIRSLNIPVINKNEQAEIVELLDKVSSIIDLRKDELIKLDELIKARFVELFVSKNYSREDLDSLSVGKGEYGAQSASMEYDSSRPRYVRITDINDDGSLNEDYVCSSNIEDDETYKLTYGDFCFARMGATVGKTYAYKSGNQIFAGYLIRYKLKLDKIIPEYLYEFTRLNEYWNWVLLNQSGAAQPGINAKKYGSLMIPVAPLEEQHKFAKFVKQVDKSKVVDIKAA